MDTLIGTDVYCANTVTSTINVETSASLRCKFH